jgi:hypothetical protein
VLAHITTLWKSWSINSPSGQLAWEATEYIYCAQMQSVKQYMSQAHWLRYIIIENSWLWFAISHINFNTFWTVKLAINTCCLELAETHDFHKRQQMIILCCWFKCAASKKLCWILQSMMRIFCLLYLKAVTRKWISVFVIQKACSSLWPLRTCRAY